MIKAALAYAAAGFPVFPCKETNERARGSKAPYTPNGLHDASTDADAIASWWREWPCALIGFPTGLASNTAVVDLDVKERPAPEMLLALRRFADFPRTAVARTQSNGLHLYFAYPDAAEMARLQARSPVGELTHIGNKTNLFRRVDGAPVALMHIDVRGEGGYVIAPPSRMENGKSWEWILRPGRDWRLARLPERLLDLIAGATEAAPPAPPPRLAYCSTPIEDRSRRYMDAAIRGICADARAAPGGERNQRVFECALRLGDFVRGGQISTSEAKALLLANLPAGVNAAEKKINQTIDNGLAGGNRVFTPERLRA